MAKRRAEDALLLHDPPSKSRYRALSVVDVRPGSTPPDGGVSPPSLLAVTDGRSRKRPYDAEDSEKPEEETLHREPAHRDPEKHAVLTSPTSARFQERRGSGALTSSKKRPRGDCAGLETTFPEANAKADEDSDAEDCNYNSFQFWRVPLPELDLSLLEGDPQRKDKPKVKGSSSVAMET